MYTSCFKRAARLFIKYTAGVSLLSYSFTAMAGIVVSGVNLTVNADDTVTVTSSGTSAFPGGVGGTGTNLPYINGWSVTGGAINWTDTNNNPVLRMDSAGIDVLIAGGVANSNGNKTGGVTLAGSTVLGSALRASNGVGTSAFTTVAVQNGGTTFEISGSVTVIGINPDIAITIADSADPVTAGGGTVTYIVTAENMTTNPATGVNVTVSPTLPAGTTLVSATPSGGGAYVGTNWNVGNIGSLVSEFLTLVYSVGSSTTDGASIVVTATLASLNETDNSATNDSDSETTTVATESDLSASMTGPSVFSTPGNATFNLVISNAGPSDAANVVVTDTLDVAFVSVTTIGCTEDPAGYQDCSLGTIAAGDSAAYDITFALRDVGTQITNSATVASGTVDTNAANNNSSTVAAATARPIPTLSQLSFFAVALMLLSAGMTTIKRQKRRNNNPSHLKTDQ